MDQAKKAPWDLGIVVFAMVTLFLGIPAFMISRAPRDYAYLDFHLIWSVGLILAVLFGVVVAVGHRALSWWKPDAASSSVFFLAVWVCLSGFLAPIATSVQLVDPVSIPTDFIHFVLVVIVSIAATFAARTRLRVAVVAFLVILVVTSVLPTISVLRSFASRDKAVDGISQLAAQSNILVISFDGLPGALTDRMILENPVHRQRFKDFVLFDNAVATAGYTYASLLGVVHGNRDFTGLGETPKLLEERLDNAVLPINQEGIDVYTYGDYNRFNLDDSKKVQLLELAEGITLASRVDDVLHFFQFVFVRVGTKHAARGLAALSGTALRFAQLERPESEEISDLLVRLRAYDGPWWDRKFLATIQDYYGFLRNLRVGTAPRGLRYMHFAFTHFPVDFDEVCGYHGDEPQWYASAQNEAGAIRENECALVQFGAFLDRLEAIGAYQNSLIVLMSDHGKPSAYYSQAPDDYLVNGHEIFGFGRFRPFLAIKKPSSSAELPRVEETLVLLDDLARTLCLAVGVDSNCQQFPGIDLLGDELSSEENYFLYVPESEKATHIYDTHRQVELSRAEGLLEAMQGADGVELVASKP